MKETTVSGLRLARAIVDIVLVLGLIGLTLYHAFDGQYDRATFYGILLVTLQADRILLEVRKRG